MPRMPLNESLLELVDLPGYHEVLGLGQGWKATVRKARAGVMGVTLAALLAALTFLPKAGETNLFTWLAVIVTGVALSELTLLPLALIVPRFKVRNELRHRDPKWAKIIALRQHGNLVGTLAFPPEGGQDVRLFVALKEMRLDGRAHTHEVPTFTYREFVEGLPRDYVAFRLRKYLGSQENMLALERQIPGIISRLVASPFGERLKNPEPYSSYLTGHHIDSYAVRAGLAPRPASPSLVAGAAAAAGVGTVSGSMTWGEQHPRQSIRHDDPDFHAPLVNPSTGMPMLHGGVVDVTGHAFGTGSFGGGYGGGGLDNY